MRKVFKGILLITIILTITIFLPAFMDSMDLFGSNAKADTAGWSENNTGGGTPTDPADTSIKFHILEIVPYKGMGEIGYLIGGQEPVNEELFDRFNAQGDVSFLGDAITPYDAYKEQPLPASGQPNDNWYTTNNYYAQNGYFAYVGASNGGYYQKLTGQEVYTRVADKAGDFKAKLVSEQDGLFNKTGGKTNEKNVKAYFVYGKPDGVALYSDTKVYTPSCVNRSKTHTGNYDYNSQTKTFVLNRGHGQYNVLFSKNTSGANYYYMTADYEIVDDCSGDYSWSITYENVGAGNGNYIMEASGIAFSHNSGDNNQNVYKWVQSDLNSDKANYYQEGTPGAVGEKIWVKNQKFIKNLEYGFGVTLVNNEWFKRFTLGLSGADCNKCQVDVVTLTPKQLNTQQYQDYLSEADMIYINDNYNHNQAYISLYETKSYEGRALPASQKFDSIKSTLNFGDNDLSWDSTMKLFNRAAGVKSDGTLGGYRAAMVFDDTFYQNAVKGSGEYRDYSENVNVGFSWNDKGATVSNLAKLYIMLYQRDPAKFYKTFLGPAAPRKITEVVSAANSTGSTGSFVRPDSTASDTSVEATYWNGNTFCPYLLDDSGSLIAPNINTTDGKALIEKEIPNFNITATTNDMISNILVLNGMDIFTNKFIQPLDLPADALEQAKIYIASINGGTVPSGVNIAGYICVITEEGTGYGGGGNGGNSGEDGESGSNLRTYTSVLNIQPTADFTSSETKIRNLLIFCKDVRVTNMTCAEFNSSILDINTHYDIIFIGGGAGRFNNNPVIDPKTKDIQTNNDGNEVRNTLFNDASLNGGVYHKGDNAVTTGGTKRFTRNDLTSQKVSDLKEFISAGYPVVLDNSLYTLTGAVKSDTNLYDFIRTVKGSAPPANFWDYTSFKNTDTNTRLSYIGLLSSQINLPRPMIRIIQPTLSATDTVNYKYVDSTKTLIIEFSILSSKLVPDPSRRYNAYLYLDYNEDGIFSESERLTVESKDGSTWTNKEEANDRSYTYSFDMSKYNGVFQWQVKVVRQSVDANNVLHDTPIRSEITGYTAATRKETIRILQIKGNTSTDCSLESAQNDGSSLIHTYGGTGVLKDYNLEFHTMTVDEFLQQYRNNPYPGADANATNELAGYHLLIMDIMDNQTDKLNNDNGALTNIKDEIQKGIGIIFTKGTINYDNQTDYLSSGNLLFEQQKSYPLLCKTTDISVNPYYIFDFFNYGFTKTLLQKEETYHTTYITKSNEGADSQYPYKIGDAINIADTSYVQDATIDYNRSVGTPLIGWYSLSDSRSPVVRTNCTISDATPKIYTGIYSSSPNDVKNNYYLFNRGRIYYSGISLTSADRPGNDAEIKLFINTIIASYKTSGRIIAPTIRIKQPAPVNNKIELTNTEVEGKTELPVIFEITDGTPSMNLSIQWKDSAGNLVTASGDWNKALYQVSPSGGLTPVTDMTKIGSGTYAVKIPVADLEGTHTLSISDEYSAGKTVTLDTEIEYSSAPITVTIDNYNLFRSTYHEEKCLYVDIDYADEANELDYLNHSPDIRLDFTINKGGSTELFNVSVTDFDGKAINTKNPLIIHTSGSSTTYQLNTKEVPKGHYYILLPAYVMDKINSKDVKITALLDTAKSGSAKVTLLRRGLFKLD